MYNINACRNSQKGNTKSKTCVSLSESRDPRQEDWKTLLRVDRDLRNDEDEDEAAGDDGGGSGESVAVFLLLLVPIFSV